MVFMQSGKNTRVTQFCRQLNFVKSRLCKKYISVNSFYEVAYIIILEMLV